MKAFSSTLFRYPGLGGWVFARVPDARAPTPTAPWGRTAVWATVNGKRWATSVWRDRRRGSLLPVPKKIRGALDDGDVVRIVLELRF